jgi:hypothetical protein
MALAVPTCLGSVRALRQMRIDAGAAMVDVTGRIDIV